MLMIRRIHLPERPGAGRLGRHVEHDPRSLAYAVSEAGQIVSAKWERHCAPFDQASLGSCAGNAGAGVCMTDPIWKAGRALTEEDAVRIYEQATRIDGIPGHYPPDDTGSSGLAVAKILKRLGFISSYRHAFSLKAALLALGRGPIMVGIPWYTAMDRPRGKSACVSIGGTVRGGHEVELVAIDVKAKTVRGANSWGPDWGDGGYFTMTFDTLGALLAQQGDATILEP